MLEDFQARSFWEILPNTESVTYDQRIPAASPNTADAEIPYTLTHVKRRPMTEEDVQEAIVAGVAMANNSQYVVFMIWQDDLDQQVSRGAIPYLSYQILDGNGQLWEIENVKRHETLARWDCLSRLAR